MTVAGLVTSVQHRVAKASGNPYGMITVEDFNGEVTVMFMGKTYREYSEKLVNDEVVVIRGRINMRDDGVAISAFSLEPIAIGAQGASSGPLRLQLQESEATRSVLENLDATLKAHPGKEEVHLIFVDENNPRSFKLQPTVKITDDLLGELKALLGTKGFAQRDSSDVVK